MLSNLRIRRPVGRLIVYLLALAVLAWTLLPIVWIIGTAFKIPSEYMAYPPILFPSSPTLNNFVSAFETFHAWEYVRNSLIVTFASTALALVVGSMGAYSIARLRFRGRSRIAFWILALRMFPAIALAIPFFAILQWLRLLNTYWGLIITYQLFLLPFVVWMMKGFFEEIPPELEEAAEVDGCSRIGAFVRIVLPLTAPGLAATGTFAALMSWNEFLFALLFTQNRATQPVTVLVAGFIAPEKGVLWGEISAVGLISIIPILVFTMFLQKYLIRGLTMGAIKG